MNAMGKKWMAQDLWVECSACDGKGEVKESVGGTFERVPAGPGMFRCPMCEGKGMMKSGATWGEFERLRHALEEARRRVAELQGEARTSHADHHGA